MFHGTGFTIGGSISPSSITSYGSGLPSGGSAPSAEAPTTFAAPQVPSLDLSLLSQPAQQHGPVNDRTMTVISPTAPAPTPGSSTGPGSPAHTAIVAAASAAANAYAQALDARMAAGGQGDRSLYENAVAPYKAALNNYRAAGATQEQVIAIEQWMQKLIADRGTRIRAKYASMPVAPTTAPPPGVPMVEDPVMTVTAEDIVTEPPPPAQSEESGGFPWLYVGIGAGVLVVGGVAAAVLMRR